MFQCVYSIQCLDENIKEFYIGSTDNFKQRVRGHKKNYNMGMENKVYKFIRENGGISNWEINYIQKFKFLKKEELREYEQWYIDTYKPELNVIKALQTKEGRKEYKRLNGIEYREKNKEKIKKQKLTPIECKFCKKMITRCNMSGHIKKWCKSTPTELV